MLKSKGSRVATTVATVAVLAASASAASAHPYKVNLSPAPPATVPSGSQATVTANVTNTYADGSIRSLNLTAPAGFTVVSATRTDKVDGTTSVAGNTVRLRNADIDRNETATFAVKVETPCTATTGTWSPEAKTRGDFSGTSFTLTASQSQLKTATRGSCGMKFAVQPASAEVGQPITGTAFDPSGPPVTVTLTDGDGNNRAISGVPVTMALASGSGTLGGTKTRNTSNGSAAFNDLTVSKAGSYVLKASATVGSTSTSVTANSSAFESEDDAVACQNNLPCSANARVDGTLPNGQPYFSFFKVETDNNPDANVPDDSGLLRASYNTQNSLDCIGYTERQPDTAVYQGLNRIYLVTQTFSPNLVADPNTLEACVGLPYNFIRKGQLPLIGGQAQKTEINNGKTEYVDLLPNCFLDLSGLGLPLVYTPPCVVSRGRDADGNPFIQWKTKASAIDPRGRS